MSDFLMFLARIGSELYELFAYAKSGQADPQTEYQLALRIVRKAKDEQARKEIEGA